MSARPDRDFLRASVAAQRGNDAEMVRHTQASFKNHGNKAAALNLAELHYIGRGVRQSYDEALEYYYQALQTTPG